MSARRIDLDTDCWNCGYDVRGFHREGAVCPECGESVDPAVVQARRDRFLRASTLEVIASLAASVGFATGGFLFPLVPSIVAIAFWKQYPKSAQSAAIACQLRSLWCMVVPVSLGSWCFLSTPGGNFMLVLMLPLLSAVIGSVLFLVRWRRLARRAAVPGWSRLRGIPLWMMVLNVGTAAVLPIALTAGLYFLTAWSLKDF